MYIQKALESVLSQDYPHIQLIVCDDASTDNSVSIIERYKKGKDIQFFENRNNIGNCRTFNEALQHAKGKYVIDLAGDDMLMPGTLKERVLHFEQQDIKIALTYSDAVYINEHDEHLFDFSNLNPYKPCLNSNMFKELFLGRFICPPSVIFRTDALKALGGYDESLSYEDFDIWMRLARQYEFAYSKSKSVAKRILSGSLSSRFYEKGDPAHLISTLKICKKALQMAHHDEIDSIGRFSLYHFRLAYFTVNFNEAKQFYALSNKIIKIDCKNRFLKFLLDKGINIYLLYRLYIKIKLKDSKFK